MVDINISAHNVFSGITFIRYTQNREIGKTNNSKVFGRNKTEGHKKDNQSRLRSPMLLARDKILISANPC